MQILRPSSVNVSSFATVFPFARGNILFPRATVIYFPFSILATCERHNVSLFIKLTLAEKAILTPTKLMSAREQIVTSDTVIKSIKQIYVGAFSSQIRFPFATREMNGYIV